MITRIEALNYRCLRYIRQDLGPFHVLVGPNASGKTTFLDVIAFLGRLVSDGPEAAVVERTQNFQDLVWGRQGDRFELAVEASIPLDLVPVLGDTQFETIRYEVAVSLDSSGDVVLLNERVALRSGSLIADRKGSRDSFPQPKSPPTTIKTKKSHINSKLVVLKERDGTDHFYSEYAPFPKKSPTFRLGPRKSALGNLPFDETSYPVANWFKLALTEGVQQIALNSQLIRNASPPLRIKGFKADGSNLSWVVESLRPRSPHQFRSTHDPLIINSIATPPVQNMSDRFRDWIDHLRTALPDIEDIRTVERPDDKHRYIMIRYQGGIEVPSWMASDGTLRLLALTLPAYLNDFKGIYLIEEPENGIHPRAVETMFQSLSSVYDAQILMATHSPVILSIADPATVLCFAKSDDEATDIVPGNKHPALRDWRGETNLGVLFAAGVLG